MNKKAGLNLTMFLIGIVLFVAVIVGFYSIPNNPSGFWSTYSYTPPSNNLSQLDKSSELNTLSSNLACDVTGISGDNRTCDSKTPLEKAGTTVSTFSSAVNQAWGALVTLYNSFGMTKTMVEFSFTYLNIPPELTALSFTILLLLIVFAVIYVIFGRSDV